MADEVKWGRVREWDGAKGCPLVAVHNFCQIRQEGKWLWYPGYLGLGWSWRYTVTAYRIPAEFDHLDDNGNPAGPFAGYTSAELRAAADAKDAADDPLKLWRDLFRDACQPDDDDDTARILRDGAAKLLGVTL